MLPTRPPAPPAPGARAAKLTTTEEEVAAVNADFATLLATVHGKGAPRRFLEPVRERSHRADDHRFTESELETFMRSLDAQLVPSSLTDDVGMRRIHRLFWDARTASFAAFLRRSIDETLEKTGRRIDPSADTAELHAMERRITRALLRADRARLQSFVGRRGVEDVDLAFALWTSHAEGWFLLATAPAVLPAFAALLRASTYEDGLEQGRRGSDFTAHAHRAPRAGADGGCGMKPYQALAGRSKSSNK